MQNSTDEEKKEEKQQDEDADLQVGGREATRAIVPVTLEDLLTLQPDGLIPQPDDLIPQPDDLIPRPDPDLSMAGFLASLVPPPDLSIPNTSEDMINSEPQQENEEEEEEELVILDPEHILVKRLQDALNNQFSKTLERLKQELYQKRAIKKTGNNQELAIEAHRLQEHRVRLQNKIEDVHQSKAQAEARRQQAQDQLEAVKSACSDISQQNSQDKANVSKLHATLDKGLQHLRLTQGVSEDLHSKVKTIKNIRHRAGAEQTQAEEQLQKQELYIDRLTKELERLTLQVSMYEAQKSAQAEQTQAVKEALTKAEMDMESLLMSRKHLLQQWNSSFVSISRKDEEFSAMQEAVRSVEDQVSLLHRALEMNKKDIAAEQKKNETLTAQLNWCEIDCATLKKVISQKQTEQEALQTQYSTCLRSLQETERTLITLTNENAAYQSEVNDQKKRLEKASSVRLELEDKIMTHIQQQLTHSNAAKHSQHLISKLNTMKNGKTFQFEHMHNEMLSIMMESQKVDLHVNSLTLIQKTLDEETTNYNKLLTLMENDLSSFVRIIEQKQTTASTIKAKIFNIVAKTGNEDLSPLQIEVQKIKSQIEELAACIKSDQQLWLQQQGALVELSQDLEINRRTVHKLQTEYIIIQQKKIRLESQTEQAERENAELEKNLKMLRRDLEKLSDLLRKNKQLNQALEQENTLMTADFIHKVKEAERESVDLQMRLEKVQEETEILLRTLEEAEQQILLRERKILIMKETRSAVDSELGQEEIQKMKGEIHRMETRVSQLTKQQEQLMRQSEAAVAKREQVLLRKEAMGRSSRKEITEAELRRSKEGLKRTIQKTHKEVAESDQMILDLEKSKDSLSERIVQQKQHLTELSSTSNAEDSKLENLKDDKDMKQAYLIGLQSRNKKLQEVFQGSYRVSSTSETVGAAQQSQKERLEAVGTMLAGMLEQFPQHQGALHRLSQAVEAYKLLSQK